MIVAKLPRILSLALNTLLIGIVIGGGWMIRISAVARRGGGLRGG